MLHHARIAMRARYRLQAPRTAMTAPPTHTAILPRPIAIKIVRQNMNTLHVPHQGQHPVHPVQRFQM